MKEIVPIFFFFFTALQSVDVGSIIDTVFKAQRTVGASEVDVHAFKMKPVETKPHHQLKN